MNDSFLPDNYDIPTPAGNFMKFEVGSHKFRILSSPKLGWENWIDKPDGTRGVQRFEYDQPHPATAKHFWVMVVWNYDANRLQILSINQATIQKQIKALAMNPDWGSPLSYDLTVARTGKTMKDTEYSVTPSPKKPLSKEIVEKYTNSKIDLDKWMKGEEAFEPTTEQVAAKINKDFPDKEESVDETDLPFGDE